MRLNKLTYLILLFSLIGWAQPKVETSIDTTKNKIGAQFNLTLRTNVDTLSQVTFPGGTTFGAMEVIRNYKVDTVKKDNRYELIKKYGLANFDSGSYQVPRLKVIINGKSYFSDSIRVDVAPVAVDTLKQKLFDIKPVAEEASGGWMIWLWIALGILACGIGGAIVYLLVRKAQQKQVEEEIFKTPIEKATTLLSNLEKKELVQRGEVKDYYSQMTDIARTYIEEVIHIPAMESTTAELIPALRAAALQKNLPVSADTFENLERVLQQADLVKFAKSRPMDFQIADDRTKIEKVIVTIDRSIPIEPEEDDGTEAFLEAQRVKLMRQKRKRRILISAASVLVVLVCIGGYFVATKGFTRTWDSVTGKQTLYLLESEWVKSEYGNPSVQIETPAVLFRNSGDKVLPKDVMALMKEFQMFGYGSLTGDFYIGVSTNTYKGDEQVDLEKAMNAAISMFETQGAQNMLVKQETYDTREGISGRKAYGTFSRIDSGSRSSGRYYYEMLLFGQQNGLQLITLVYPEGDTYAKEISDRVLNSVELKTVQQ